MTAGIYLMLAGIGATVVFCLYMAILVADSLAAEYRQQRQRWTERRDRRGTAAPHAPDPWTFPGRWVPDTETTAEVVELPHEDERDLKGVA